MGSEMVMVLMIMTTATMLLMMTAKARISG